MKNEYIGGGITATGKLWEEALYDAGNNAITAQFDGRGAISRYAVMNKYEVFSKFYTLLTIDGVPLDYMREKKAEMIGKRQITTVYTDKAEIEIIQFLDGGHWVCKYTPNREDRYCRRHTHLETKWLQESLGVCAENLNFLNHPCELCNERGHLNIQCKLFHDRIVSKNCDDLISIAHHNEFSLLLG